MVGEEGVEPSRPCGQQILSLSRLPFRHSPTAPRTLIRKLLYKGEIMRTTTCGFLLSCPLGDVPFYSAKNL